MAEGGTLFLDEIGEMPLHLQAKLLSTIEEKTLKRLGSESFRRVNVRIIAATGVDLERSAGTDLPQGPLLPAERHPDPPAAAPGTPPGHSAALRRPCSSAWATGMRSCPRAEQQKLMQYDWPGNVRELKNILERAVILQHGSELRPSLLLEASAGFRRSRAPSAACCR